MTQLRMLSLCSGIGGIEIAAGWTGGIKVVGQIEKNRFCQAVLRKQFPGISLIESLEEVAHDAFDIAAAFGPVDLVAGGIPCQPFSLAGERLGTEDDRHLWPSAFTIIKKANPTWVVIENVTGFIDLALDLVQTDLESAEYEVRAYVLPACAIGAPHRRERIFIVAHASNGQCERREEFQARWEQIPGGRDVWPDAGRRGEELAHTYSVGHRGIQPECQPQRKDTPGLEDVDALILAHTQSTECDRTGNTRPGRDGFTDSSAALANANRPGWQECESSSITAQPRISAPGTDARLADADSRGCQRRSQHSHQSDTAVLCSSATTGSSPQSGMGRELDGLSAWLDSYRWPALAGQEQEAWEAPRTITGKQPYRNQRLKALGNAVVPQQIYPILQAIVDIHKDVEARGA